jgi:TetR/AcrR family transcriptional regulator
MVRCYATSPVVSQPVAEVHMSDLDSTSTASEEHLAEAKPARKRPAPGERRIQILQTLAQMLEQPGGERITTAALAARIDVSEAALYRHFASKAQMFEGLIEFIESSILGLINKINAGGADPSQRAAAIVSVVLQFAQKNPGMCRVMTGDALLLEHERLQARMTSLHIKIETQLRQVFRELAEARQHPAPTAEGNVRANLAASFIIARMHRYVRSHFRSFPQDQLEPALEILVQ